MDDLKKKDILIAFGKHFQNIRESKEISLRKLELLSEVDHSQIHRIEKGMTSPSLITLISLSHGLNISLKELIDFE